MNHMFAQFYGTKALTPSVRADARSLGLRVKEYCLFCVITTLVFRGKITHKHQIDDLIPECAPSVKEVVFKQLGDLLLDTPTSQR